jgi:hypothetical protein
MSKKRLLEELAEPSDSDKGSLPGVPGPGEHAQRHIKSNNLPAVFVQVLEK